MALFTDRARRADAQLLDGLDDRFALLTAGDRLAAGRQRSLAATVEWSYQLLDDHERRVFRAVSVFPGPFTLEAAEAVAGDGAGPVLRLVDCSLLVPPRASPDGRSRYVMLETLRAYGAGLLTGAGEGDGAAATLAGYALRVAERAVGGTADQHRGLDAVQRLDAEDATLRQALAWAMNHDAAVALRLAVALAPWWDLRGRSPGRYALLREAAGRAAAGSETWCARNSGSARWHSARPIWPGRSATSPRVRDAIGDRGPSRALVDCLGGRSSHC